jgi:ubiquinone/menaquinone biosynthesis C-methylase UbiE
VERITEPELMHDRVQAAAYAEADFDEPNRSFVEELSTRISDLPVLDRVVDLGCGPAAIPIALVARHGRMRIDAVDGAEAMIAEARSAARGKPGAERIRFVYAHLPSPELSEASYDLVLSNSLLHHFSDPAAFWSETRRLAAPGASIFVVDLRRPPSRGDVSALVDRYSGDEPEILKRDFHRSLCAAFTPQEVRRQVARAGLSLTVQSLGDRHLMAWGRA